MSWVRSLDARFLAPAPPERLAGLRVLVGGFALSYLLVRLPHLLAVARFDGPRFDPVGPLWWLAGPVDPAVGHVVLVATIVTGFGFVAGWRWRLSGLAFAVLFLVVTTYRSSWGQVFHTENLPALHLMLLAASPAADAWSLDARRRSTVTPGSAHGTAIRLITVVTVLSYMVAGWAKLRNGGIDWIAGDVLRNHIAHDALRKELVGSSSSPLGVALLPHGWVFPPLAAFSMAVELGAPLALLGRRLRLGWAMGAWAFHAGVLALMAIAFPYQLSGVAFASLFPLERLPGWARARVRLAEPAPA